jgi:hypothetical protein
VPREAQTARGTGHDRHGTLVVPSATALALAAPSPASVAPGSTGPVTLSATLTRTSDNTVVSGGSVSFTVDGTSVGSATTNAAGVATLATYNPSALGTGPHTVQATFAEAVIATTTYLASTSGTQTLTVGKSNQTIAFGSITNKTFGDPAFVVTATATSGLTVSFAATGNCSINTSTNTVSLTGAGSCTVTASQAGNASFNAAPDVPQTFLIAKASATLALSGWLRRTMDRKSRSPLRRRPRTSPASRSPTTPLRPCR